VVSGSWVRLRSTAKSTMAKSMPIHSATSIGTIVVTGTIAVPLAWIPVTSSRGKRRSELAPILPDDVTRRSSRDEVFVSPVPDRT
jgi:hypothetical protein